MSDERFPKDSRIRRRAEFLSVQRRGRKVLLRDVIVFALRTGRATRVGFTVSGKVGNAVARNRVKRRLREGWRRLWVEGPGGWDVVVIAKRSAVACEYNELAAQLDRVKRRLAEWG